MKNLRKEDKNKIYAVIILIMVILILIGFLLVFGSQKQTIIEENSTTKTTSNNTTTITTENNELTSTTTTTKSNDSTSTTTRTTISTTTSTTKTTTSTTTTATQSLDELAHIAIKKYFDSFYLYQTFKTYNIEEVEILDSVDCYNLEKNNEKIYASVNVIYEKQNKNISVNPSEIELEDGTFSLTIICIINKKEIKVQDIKQPC